MKDGERVYFARENETVEEHLAHVAQMASVFAYSFGGAELAAACGYLHDLGKYTDDYQDYLQRSIKGEGAVRGETIHSLQGGCYALEKFRDVEIADFVVNIVASHHGELIDMVDDEGRRTAERRVKAVTRKGKSIDELYREIVRLPEVQGILKKIEYKKLRNEFGKVFVRLKDFKLGWFGLHLFIKMIYSCLVDADRCDAAGFDGRGEVPQWDEISAALDAKLATFANTSPLNRVRAEISRQCFNAGNRERGVYTLNIPTGGGKTLSSLRFAIQHAKKHGFKRIIYVIPYLSIIDQTAKELRAIFGAHADEWMLEHHSNIVLTDESEEDSRGILTERWQSPIIVTTMVRFMETVMSNRAADLRKLHNMSEAVFVFDEFQALPLRCAALFSGTINFLTKMCASSAVLCTATQSSSSMNEAFPIYMAHDHELVSLKEEEKLLFKRVHFEFEKNDKTTAEVAQFAADLISKGKSVLVVLNTKKTAEEVYQECKKIIGNVPRFFLSTNLCAQHRKDNIKQIKDLLKDDFETPLLCVSTQLIEAGVDLSFGAVIRASAGVDSIIQAGGRCNRNGECKEPQAVYVVKVASEKLTNLPDIQIAQDVTRRICDEFPRNELTEQKVVDCFYEYLKARHIDELCYPIRNDALMRNVYDVLGENVVARNAYRTRCQKKYKGCAAGFATAANAFWMIDAVQISAVVPYQDGEVDVVELVTEFTRTFDPKEKIRILRKLQPYTVSVYANNEAWLQSISEEVKMFESSEERAFYFIAPNYYDAELGLVRDGGEQAFMNI